MRRAGLLKLWCDSDPSMEEGEGAAGVQRLQSEVQGKLQRPSPATPALPAAESNAPATICKL